MSVILVLLSESEKSRVASIELECLVDAPWELKIYHVTLLNNDWWEEV